MDFITWRLIAPAALLLAASCATQPPRSADARGGAPADAVDAYLQAVMEKNHVPGMAVAIVRDGKVERLSAYGFADLESEAKVGPDTSFQIASATKVFTGTLVMLLVQEGKLDLDAPLSKYLPDAPETWKGMTVRHLTAHASGLKDLPDEDSSAATVAERYEAAKKTSPAYAPGERSEYGAHGFRRAHARPGEGHGERFEELLRSRIFQPLGFSCTRYEHARQEGPVRVADVIPRRASHLSLRGRRAASRLVPLSRPHLRRGRRVLLREGPRPVGRGHGPGHAAHPRECSRSPPRPSS